MAPARAKAREVLALEAIAAKQDEILAKLDQLLPAQPPAAPPATNAPTKGTKKE